MGTKGVSRVLMAVCVVVGVVGLARGGTVVLAHTGGPATDGNGYYLTFTDPVLNNLGQSAFRAKLMGTDEGTDDDTAIFRVDGVGGAVICHEGWPTIGFNGRFWAFSSPAINNVGQVAFRGDASGTLLGVWDMAGIYRGSGGVLPTELVRGGKFAPDGNGYFLMMSDTPVLNDAGMTAFWASFTATAGGFNDDTAVVKTSPSGPVLVARAGSSPLEGNGQFADFGFDSTRLNQGGWVVCKARLRDTSGGQYDNTGIYHMEFHPSGTPLLKVARQGEAPPGGNGEFQSFGDPTIDNILGAGGTGRVAFHAWLRNTSGGTDDDSGIFRGTSHGLSQIAREGLSPPEGNGQYSNFGLDIAQNDSWVAFRAWLRNTSGGPLDEQGLYRGDGSTTTKIARRGEPSPDGNGVFHSLAGPVMNDPGHVAFRAQLSGTAGGSSDDKGIFIGDGVDIVAAARTGGPLLGSTIAELHFAAGPHCRSGLNDLAQVAYRAVLADGREVLAFYTPLVQWSGGVSGGWAAKANWTLSILPDYLYDVAITPAGSADVAGPRSDGRVKSLTIGSTGGGTAALNLTYGGGLTALEDVTIGPDGLILVGAGRTLSAAALLNQGTLAFEAGQAHVLGDVTNLPEGQILVPPGANVWLHDRVENAGVVDVGPGAVVNLAELIGNGCTGAGTTRLEGHVRPGLGIGQMGFEGDVILGRGCVMHVELGGLVAGLEHDQVLVGGDLVLDGLLQATLVRPFELELGQHFEIIDVGAAAAGQFSGLGEGDVVGNYGGLDLFVTYAAGDGNDVALFTIPEPLAVSVLALGALVLLRRRRCGVAATATGAERRG